MERARRGRGRRLAQGKLLAAGACAGGRSLTTAVVDVDLVERTALSRPHNTSATRARRARFASAGRVVLPADRDTRWSRAEEK
jgi:hypothetical protein